jgi:hypothetical protein
MRLARLLGWLSPATDRHKQPIKGLCHIYVPGLQAGKPVADLLMAGIHA